ncbi:hypothetical protein [Dyadobacter luticola]|uniref:Uncharacterized protein n=1 Tax=Dyadobacter luticola TaxID=1979387 RepID=A0A5R9KSJ7_9BACT|nr:hypothetical protein [Dyadobacter luticola]TLU99193.1 hypothetical protein FEN17_21705 [Dyadobacter luticola]
MKKRTLFWALTLVLLGGARTFSQVPRIALEFWTENEIIPLDEKSSVRLVSTGTTTLLPVKQSSITMTDSLQKKEQKIIFNLNGYELAYDSIPVAWNPLQPKWTVKVDSPPFADENKYLLQKLEKNPLLIYQFDNGAGDTFVGYKYDNPKAP